MKKLLFFFCFTAALSANTYALSEDLVNLGLVSQLVEMKYFSEAWSARIVTDTSRTKQQKDSALVNYNEVRIRIDRIIYQMIADMRERNSIKTYKNLNNYYTTHRFSESEDVKENIKSYVLAFKELHSTYKKNINPDKSKFITELITPAVVLSIVGTGWTILKGVNERQGKKVDGIAEMLDNLRLNPPPDLAKAKK